MVHPSLEWRARPAGRAPGIHRTLESRRPDYSRLFKNSSVRSPAPSSIGMMAALDAARRAVSVGEVPVGAAVVAASLWLVPLDTSAWLIDVVGTTLRCLLVLVAGAITFWLGSRRYQFLRPLALADEERTPQ